MEPRTRILVTYATKSGSTADVAEFLGRQLREAGLSVDVCPIKEAPDPGAYSAVVVGGPMTMGWHGDAVAFLKQHSASLCQMPVAWFATMVNLTWTDAREVEGVPVYQDPTLAKRPQPGAKLSVSQRRTTASAYLKPVFEEVGMRPVSLALFGGKLDYGTLDFFTRLFVQVAIRAPEGDFRNWEAMREWVQLALPALGGANAAAPAVRHRVA